MPLVDSDIRKKREFAGVVRYDQVELAIIVEVTRDDAGWSVSGQIDGLRAKGAVAFSQQDRSGIGRAAGECQVRLAVAVEIICD